MSSILSSQGVVLATAMAAVSGTIILLAFRLQKSFPPPNQNFSSVNDVISSDHSPHLLPRSCISSDERRKERKKKKVQFAEDVVDPIGNSEEYRRRLHIQQFNTIINNKNDKDTADCFKNRLKRGERMPENRAALYNGILRDRVVHRVAYSC